VKAVSCDLIQQLADDVSQEKSVAQPATSTLLINDGSYAAERHALYAFLYKFRRSPHTLRRYTTELSRLWRWAQWQGKFISSLSTLDLEHYEEFLRDPQPRDMWVMTKRYKKDDEGYRPFTGPLSISSIQHAFAAIQSLMTAWLKLGYIKTDPMAVKAKINSAHMSERPALNDRPVPVPSEDRWFDDQMSEAIRNALAAMPEDTRNLKAKKVQYTLVVRLLTISGMRVGELANATQGNLRDKGNGWWLTIIGKGNKERDIPIPANFIADALIPWREFHVLPPLPSMEEETPLLPPRIYRPRKKAMTTRMALNIVKEVAQMAIQQLPPEAHYAATMLERASNHWFRHTYATKLIDNGVPTQTILKTLGQKSEEILRVYDHKSKEARHKAVVNVSSEL